MEPVSSWRHFGGDLAVFDHASDSCQCDMRFAVYLPEHGGKGPYPVLWYLSGLTCTWANVMEKSGIQRAASEQGIAIIAPDTSPRGDNVPDDESYDLGQGAGFYLNATQAPWATHFNMEHYIVHELPAVVAEHFPLDMTRQGITGHSMGGHGALTLHLKNPDIYKTVSAFSAITSPSQVPWGNKAFTAYLGSDQSSWAPYDATLLVTQQPSAAHILIDTGDADQFLDEQLQPQTFIDAANAAGQQITYRMQPGCDHSYYFISSVVADHVAHHAKALAKS